MSEENDYYSGNVRAEQRNKDKRSGEELARQNIPSSQVITGSPSTANLTRNDISDFNSGAGNGLNSVNETYKIIQGLAFQILSMNSDASGWELIDSFREFFNGTFVETFSATVRSTGGVTTLSIEKRGGGDLTMQFSDGLTDYDTSPADSIVLTDGTATVPIINYVYIPITTKILTVSTSGFPSTEHIRVGRFFLLSASHTEADGGPLYTHNYNDHQKDNTSSIGHLSHITDWIRNQPATYKSGIAGGSSTGDDYVDINTGPTPDTIFWKSGVGVVSQLHEHAVPAIDSESGDALHVVNDPDAAYVEVTDLYLGITKDSTGTVITNNKYFNLHFFSATSLSGEHTPAYCLLPGGFYNGPSGAENDTGNFDNSDMPSEFRGVGFLICRMTFQMGSAGWTHIATRDLREPGIAGGGSTGGVITEFPEALFKLLQTANPLFVSTFVLTALTASRTITVPDSNITLVGLEVANIFTQDQTISEASPTLKLEETGVTADNIKWWFQVNAEKFQFLAVNDAESNANFIMEANRTGITIDDVSIGATAINLNGSTTKVQTKLGIGMVPTTALELSTDSAQKPTTNTWTITSDVRIKDIVSNYELGLDAIMQVHPRIWNYKDIFGFDACQGNHIGVVADEIEEAIPSTVKIGMHHYNHREIKTGTRIKKETLINEETQEEYEVETEVDVMEEIHDEVELKTFDSNDMIYTMVNAIKELKVENDLLRARLDILENK